MGRAVRGLLFACCALGRLAVLRFAIYAARCDGSMTLLSGSLSDLTLEALNVLRLTNVTVDNARNKIHVFFTPTGACWPRVPCGRRCSETGGGSGKHWHAAPQFLAKLLALRGLVAHAGPMPPFRV